MLTTLHAYMYILKTLTIKLLSKITQSDISDIVLFVSYVVTLVADGVRSVRNFNFDKAAASVLTSCVCIVI